MTVHEQQAEIEALLGEVETRVRIAERQGWTNRSVPVQLLRQIVAALRSSVSVGRQKEKDQVGDDAHGGRENLEPAGSPELSHDGDSPLWKQIEDDAVMVCRSGCEDFGEGNTPLNPAHCWACAISYRMRRLAALLHPDPFTRVYAVNDISDDARRVAIRERLIGSAQVVAGEASGPTEQERSEDDQPYRSGDNNCDPATYQLPPALLAGTPSPDPVAEATPIEGFTWQCNRCGRHNGHYSGCPASPFTLQAVSSSRETLTENDHGASLAAAPVIPDVAATETVGRIQYSEVLQRVVDVAFSDKPLWELREWLDERSWNMHLDCSPRVCHLIGLIELAFAESDYPEIKDQEAFVARRLLQFFAEELLAGNQPTTEVSSAPAASPAQKDSNTSPLPSPPPEVK